ncbi:ComF family protein [Sharpea azabuensis]|uniref:ComF family protein n=1 Tax=Sharpea azabuensis TaxID=322505 RepID=UPI003CFF53AF
MKLTILYRYNAFFQTLLFRYKGQYDYELRNAFIVSDQRFLSDYYRSHVIVVAPSDDIANKKRGFIPTAGIASSFSSNIFTGLYKKSPFKQAEQSFEGRQKIKDVIDIKNGEVLRKKKVLLFDDVITSGSTFEKCLDLVCHYHPASIEIVILATRSYHLEKNI